MKRMIVLLVVVCLSYACYGQVIEYEFSGFIDTIDDNQNNVLPGLTINQPFEGTFSYSIVPDQSSLSRLGRYNQDASISVSLDNFTLSYLDDFVYFSVSDQISPGEDRFSFMVDGQQGDYNFTLFGVRLIDSTRQAFTDDSLPLSLDLNDFTSNKLHIVGYKEANLFQIEGTITSLTLVPEPATMSLLFGGLLLMNVRMKRAKQ